ncbi:MAG: sigma-70 family RNA polymerase sigma factor [Fuerstiella sp.]
MIFPTPIPDELLPDTVDSDLMCRLETLYRKYARELFIAYYAKCSDREKANDAVHESFLRLYANGPQDLQQPKLWLLKIGTDWLLDLAKTDQRRRKLNTDFMRATSSQHPFEDVLDQGERENLRAALRRLQDPDRNILLLRYMMNWKPVEIARHLRISAEAVCVRHNRARRRLLRMLGDHAFNALPQK